VAYTISKFGVRALTETLWQELEGTGVQAILVHPGGIHTNIAKNAPHAKAEGDFERFMAELNLSQMVTPASDCARHHRRHRSREEAHPRRERRPRPVHAVAGRAGRIRINHEAEVRPVTPRLRKSPSLVFQPAELAEDDLFSMTVDVAPMRRDDNQQE
jgi:NAD(P)-dependent dehydrogenase (short-subunit alcohol dehydrogenase family)